VRFYFVCLFLHFSFTFSLANDNNKKIIDAKRNQSHIKIDGVLSESNWKNSALTDDFVQFEPNPGKSSTFKNQISILYDNQAVYIGAVLYDSQADKILKELSIRDQLANADNFSVFFDPYNSGLHGFLFQITASGVQIDAVVTDNKEDIKWNAIWESAIKINEDNWTVEIKIPLSSLRFKNEKNHNWGVQFIREIRRFREKSYWNPVDPSIKGWVQQSGKLVNLENIKTPVRLSFSPYISGYVDIFSDKANNINETNTAYNAGLDIKYGLNDAFTLDMTVIPDFGQVISDKQILNLTPFEVFFEENRQFFTEGTELFNNGNLFYSRRIGGRPLNFNEVNSDLLSGERIISNPDVSQLFNATKITGRTNSGFGLGIFNALTGNTHAEIENENGEKRSFLTNPLTNFNAVVIDRNLKNNSFIRLMNTNVWREGRFYDANATGLNFDFKNKKQTYHFGSDVSLTQKISGEDNNAGYSYNVSAGKISGMWIYDLKHGVFSKNYDPNDMGFLFNANKQFYSADITRQEFKPRNIKLQKWEYTFSLIYQSLYQPKSFTNSTFGVKTFYLWKSRNAVGGSVYYSPYEERDYFEPRTADFKQYIASPSYIRYGAFFSSDYRKPVALDINFNSVTYTKENRQNISIRFAPRFRLNDKFSIFPEILFTNNRFEPGYVNKNLVSDIQLEIKTNDVLFGIRNRYIFENTISIRWILNNNLGMNTRIRHYYDNVQYQHFGVLNKEGRVEKINFNGKNSQGTHIFDRNVNIFNIDMQINWRFLPGSDMVLVWKNQVFSRGFREELNYFSNLSDVLNHPQNNSISIRFLFFIDYLYLKKYAKL
jgi:hypothetical protein